MLSSSFKVCVVAALMVCGLLSTGLVQAQTLDPVSDILNATATYSSLFAINDVSTLVNTLYTPDCLAWYPNMPASSGMGAPGSLLTFWESLGNMTLTLNTVQLVVFNNPNVNDTAYSAIYYSLNQTGTVIDSGKQIFIWKLMNSSWQISLHIYNSDFPSNGTNSSNSTSNSTDAALAYAQFQAAMRFSATSPSAARLSVNVMDHFHGESKKDHHDDKESSRLSKILQAGKNKTAQATARADPKA